MHCKKMFQGELIGGLDILKELHSAGELSEMLPKKVKLEDRLKKLTTQAGRVKLY